MSKTIPDRDAQALTVVTVLAVLIVSGAVIWSAVAIGGLLSLAFPVWISYGIAAVFDLMWIGLMILEWSTRYDTERVRLPRNAGWAALLLSMTLITAHGSAQGFLWVGLAGAAVSLLAKSYWHIVMRTTGARLDPEAVTSVKVRRDAVHADLALIAVSRQLTRLTAKADAEKEALGIGVSAETPAHAVERVTETTTQPSHVVETPTQVVSPASQGVSHPSQPVETGVSQLITRLKGGETLSAQSAADLLGVSRATGGRRLAEAKAALSKVNGSP
ncbi:hypothetical protein [Streptomyces sp. GESEQ-35]|uniref:hypothetical protein n=1 Tax=Streptomyces sp. GESEQ-35 TaxID=2812657 RepID=UPI001B33CE4F|nr:hypothetical protein [Streptomyces sp. GESEQ-35]